MFQASLNTEWASGWDKRRWKFGLILGASLGPMDVLGLLLVLAGVAATSLFPPPETGVTAEHEFSDVREPALDPAPARHAR